MSKLTAMETGDKSKFNSELFLKGYVKNYAKLLSISEEEILHLYNAQQSQEIAIDVDSEAPKGTSSKWWLPYAMGIIIILGWFVASDHLETQQSTHDGAVTTEKKTLNITEQLADGSTVEVSEKILTEQLEEASASQPEISPLDGSVELDTTMALTEGPTGASLEVQSASEDGLIFPPVSGLSPNTGLEQDPHKIRASLGINDIPTTEQVFEVGSQEAEVPALPILKVHKEDVLAFTFSEECWVNVIDSAGKVIISRLYIKGDSVQVRGKAPFDIILGNVNGAKLTLNGQPVILDPKGQNRILRLTLGD